MSITVSPINFGNNNLTPEQRRQRRHETQEVAAGVGAAGVTAHVGATRYAGRQGSMGMLRKMYENMIKTSKAVPQGQEVATGIWGKLVSDTKKFSNHAMGFLKKFENNKILKPIIKSPIAKKATTAFGGITAFFVLITGLSDASRNGKLAWVDVKRKLEL